MTIFSDWLSAALRTVLKLALVVFTVPLVLGLIVFALAATLLSSVWALVTGRRPAVVTTFMRFRQASQQFRQYRQSPPFGSDGAVGGGGAAAGEVVDVQAREVTEHAQAKVPLPRE
jgi:hypothetical protein